MTHPLNPRYLPCRDIGHAWDWLTDTILITSSSGVPTVFVRDLQCGRCGAVRRDGFTVSGGHIQRRGNTYRYPAGYLVAGGVTRQDVRDQVFADLLTVTGSNSRLRSVG